MIVNCFKFDKVNKEWELNTKKKYDVIYADPPNQFKMQKTGGGFKSGAVAKYPVMDLDQICALPVNELASDNAIIFLWVQTALSGGTGNNIGDPILDSWGFKYRSKFYWDKMSFGMGSDGRNQVEELWYARRGEVKALHLTRQSTLVRHKRVGHSVKPDIFRKIIEQAVSNLSHNKKSHFSKNPKMIELFARKAPFRRKWDYWGNELH
jgi:N6-adenosine-specific RNA methylase IME4